MSSASRELSARARAIVDAAERSAREGAPGRIPRGLPVTAPRQRTTGRPALRALETPRPVPAATPVAPPPPTPTPASLDAIPDPTRLLSLIERIALQAAEIRRRLDVLSAAVDRAEADLGAPAPVAPGSGSEEPAPTVAETPVAEVAPAPVAATPAAPAPAATPAPVSPPNDAARLVAIEMAVGGASRREVGDRLTNEFGIADVKDLLDSVFGRDTHSGDRMPWR